MNRINRIKFYLIIFISIFAAPVYTSQLPADLTESCDPKLQKGLYKCLVALNLDKAVDRKSLSIVLVDITDASFPRMANVNPNEMMYAASLPKIAILLGAFERINNGKMTLNAAIQDKLALMIRNSSIMRLRKSSTWWANHILLICCNRPVIDFMIRKETAVSGSARSMPNQVPGNGIHFTTFPMVPLLFR